MDKYSIEFVKNEVISCELILTSDVEFDGEYYYEQHNGHLLFAIIKAESPAHAIEKWDTILEKVSNKIFRKDYAI
jgi:hypothetical protein